MTQSGSRKQPEAAEYDVRVVAFRGDPLRTMQGLCELFGIDAPTAKRVIESAPAVLRRRVTSAQAQHYARALGSVGAQVVLEPIGGGAAAAPHARSQASEGADLEYDVLSALDSALGPTDAELPVRDLGRELALEALEADLAPLAPSAALPHEHEEFNLEALEAETDLSALRAQPNDEFELDAHAEVKPVVPRAAYQDRDEFALDEPAADAAASLRRNHHEEFDLPTTDRPSEAVLELEAVPGRHTAQPTAAPSSRAQALQRAPDSAAAPRLAPKSVTKPKAAEAQQAALRTVPPEKVAASRNLPLLRVLAGILVAAIGHWLDSSVLHGNASLLSVVAHGLALQQFVLGVRGLL